LRRDPNFKFDVESQVLALKHKSMERPGQFSERSRAKIVVEPDTSPGASARPLSDLFNVKIDY